MGIEFSFSMAQPCLSEIGIWGLNQQMESINLNISLPPSFSLFLPSPHLFFSPPTPFPVSFSLSYTSNGNLDIGKARQTARQGYPETSKSLISDVFCTLHSSVCMMNSLLLNSPGKGPVDCCFPTALQLFSLLSETVVSDFVIVRSLGVTLWVEVKLNLFPPCAAEEEPERDLMWWA